MTRIVIDGGTLNGLDVGRNLVVRRYYHVSGVARRRSTIGEHTVRPSADRRRRRARVGGRRRLRLRRADAGRFSGVVRRRNQCGRPDPVAGTPESQETRPGFCFADAGQMLGSAAAVDGDRSGSSNSLRGRSAPHALPPSGPRRRPRSIIGDAVVVAIRFDSATVAWSARPT